MSKLLANSSDIVRRLLSEGWTLSRTVGSDDILVREGFRDHIAVPYPKKDLPVGLVPGIYKKVGWRP